MDKKYRKITNVTCKLRYSFQICIKNISYSVGSQMWSKITVEGVCVLIYTHWYTGLP